MNLNFSNQPESDLNKSLIKEVIDTYGIKIKFLKTEKINIDNVLGDFSHMKTDKDKIFEMFALPENSESFDNTNYGFDSFGFLDFDNINLFVAKDDFNDICELKDIVSNLIVLPNNKVMEITNCEYMVPGINNLFTYNDSKSVYKLSCKPHEFKLVSEVKDEHLINELKVEDPNRKYFGKVQTSLYKDTKDVFENTKSDEELKEIETENYKALDDYFESLVKEKDEQDSIEVVPSVEIVNKNEVVKNPIQPNIEPDIWNGF